MQERTTLKAKKGKILTNGKDYAYITYLEVGADESVWNEIPESEYQQIMEQQKKSKQL
jgi:hypothetical protein